MSSSYKKCLYISIVFFIIGLVVLLFGLFIMQNLLKGEVEKEAILKEDTYELWGKVPGKSGVNLYKDHFFFDIENLRDVVYNNQSAIGKEMGMYRVHEFNEIHNPRFSKDNKTVEYNFWRFYRNVDDADMVKKQDDILNNVNLVIYKYII